MIQVTLYSRTDCHLCEQAHEDLLSLHTEAPHKLTVVDVDSTQDLRRAYGFEVPVVEAGPYKLRAPFTRQELLMTIRAAQDRQEQLTEVGGKAYSNLVARNQTWNSADGFAYWLGRYYLWVFNLIVLIYMGLPTLAPVLMNAGLTAPAGIIYRVYGAMCHQWGFRSFFLFGEQVVYPREAAGVEGLLTFEQATGVGEANTAEDLWAAREYRGAEGVGYKVALCERDMSIFGGILIFGVLFALSRRRLPGMHWIVWILLGLVPIGIDGVSQLISQPPLSFIPYRESTPYLRIITGFLFGFTTAWFGYPQVEETMEETRRIMATKKLRVAKPASGSQSQ
ncbi:MAG: DUF2085 domain-containing protein [Chloroflexi bacterium]|nr:DUF2085 domain-containing protein [Chloroflexota bacterium]